MPSVPEPSSQALGSRVKELRVARGMSQAQVAAGGLTGSYVSLIEAGKRLPTEAALEQLATRLGTTVAYLRTGRREADDQSVRLAVSWAELALGNGAPAEALRHLEPLLSGGGLDPDQAWRARFAAARAHESLGQLAEAISVLESLRLAAEAEPERWPWLATVVALCRCYREAGDLAYSIDLAERVLARIDGLDLADSDEQAEVAASLIASYYERGDLARAAELGRRLVERTTGGSPRARAAAYWNASIVANEQGRVGEALELAGTALTLLSGGNDGRATARLRQTYAALLLRADPPEPAAALAVLEEVAPVLAELSGQIDLAYAETEIARAKLMLGDAPGAAEAARASLARLGQEPRLETARCLVVLAQVELAVGERTQATAHLRHAAQLLDLADAGRQSAAVWAELAEVSTSAGDADEALRAYRRAVAAAGIAPSRPHADLRW